MRPRKKDRHLPAKVYQKHGAYWYVHQGKWTRLGSDLTAAMAEYSRLATGNPGGMPELIDRVLSHITPRLKPNTVKQYQMTARTLKKIFAEFAPDQVLPRHVAAVKADMADRPNSANRHLSFLRVVFAHAVEWQIVDTNPCLGIMRHAEKKRDRYLTDAEYEAIWKHGSDSLRAIMDVAYLTGQRIGDVLEIRLSDIHEGGIDFHQQKTGERVTAGMTADLDEAIKAAKALKRSARSMTLFCTIRGNRPYAYRTVRDMFMLACRKAKVADARLHDIRAKAITDAEMEGKDGQVLAGHTTRQQTTRYIRRRKGKTAELPSLPRSRAKSVSNT